LAAIQNAVRLLRLQSEDSPLQRQARLIVERQVGQLTHLVDDLLEISRITSGRIRLRLEGLDVRGVVERAVEGVQGFIAERHHRLSVRLPEQPLWLEVDAGRLEQVLVNLLHNASKYTDEGGHIELSVSEAEEHVVIRVRDNGIGIPRGLLTRIFDPFTQAERSLDRSEGGLGIGLTLAQRVIEMHGGTITANSQGPGQGSEFVIRLPVHAFQAAGHAIPKTPTAKSATAWRILVVDDNVDAADSLALLFKAANHDAQVAYSSEAALELASKYRPDFVLLDIGLPGMDGYEVARRLRQQPELKNLRLIALTGYGQESDHARSQEAGFDHHVVKPVEFESLHSLLASLARSR
jgi:CheY-like chemotaxis protein/two-component sensor histidine kinase